MYFKNNTIKILCVSFLILSPLFSACQKSVIFKNVNSRANELVHYINATEDSLILKGKRPIYRVEIFNDVFSKEIKFTNKDVKIPLHDIPVGRYVIIARLKDKLIAISLVRNEKYTNIEKPNIHTERIIARHKEVPATNTSNTKVIKKNNTRPKKTAKGYWMVRTTRGQLGFKINKRMANKTQVENYISINKKEQKTKCGKFNTLTVWEVYNISQFKKLNSRYKNYIKSKSSEHFNVVPYYKTKLKINNNLIVKH